MREILFRGKRLDNGKWVYGFYSQRKWLDGATSHYILVNATNGRGGQSEIEVDPDTVGQYTGMKDKHGNKIFEGDKLYFVPDFSYGVEMTVIWYSNGWCTKEDGSYPDRLEDGDTEDMEIIGNVWEG